MPYVALLLIAVSSLALLIKGVIERKREEKPYFPKGGICKITLSFMKLLLYAVAMNYLGFLFTTPFATLHLFMILREKVRCGWLRQSLFLW